MTLHTSANCNVDGEQSGTWVHHDCSPATPFNQGCGVQSNTDNSFGTGFNSIRGGVYATLWNSGGIQIWFFPRDKIPKDIILCPWHYELREKYESVPMFMSKGFRVLPASWKNTEATLALIRDEKAHQSEGRLVGHIFTTWSQRHDNWAEFEPLVNGLALLRESKEK